MTSYDPNIAMGAHYKHGKIITKEMVGQPLDPFLIEYIYKVAGEPLTGPQLTILKKVLGLGKRGHKTPMQDYADIIGAAQRAIELQQLETGVQEAPPHE